MNIDDDTRPGRPKSSTDEQSVKLGDALEENCCVTFEELSEATGSKVSIPCNKCQSTILS